MILRFFETLVHPAAVPADTGLPRPCTCSPCRATARMSSIMGVGSLRLARLAMQRACSGDALVDSDGTSQRLRTRISLQEARDHHVLAIGL